MNKCFAVFLLFAGVSGVILEPIIVSLSGLPSEFVLSMALCSCLSGIVVRLCWHVTADWQLTHGRIERLSRMMNDWK